MNFHALKYALAYLVPVLVVISLSSTNLMTFMAFVFIFLVLPLFELFTSGSTKNLSEAEEEMAKNDRFYDFWLYGLVPVQYATLAYFLVVVSNESLPLLVRIGMVTAYGMSCGVLGINAAHELGHRPTKYEQWMSKALLLTTLYMHFFIEHNRGHHKNVSTDDDPASSRYGEIIYTFYIRTIRDSWFSAWRLERERLGRKGLPFWSWENEMLRFQVIQAVFVLGIGLYFGFSTLLFFLAAALVGIFLLETVNYIEHYGLRRKKKGNHYERTLPIHSWNSNHPVGRLVLLELSRHSDHHYMASRKYQILRHFDESPQMPTGYPGMMVLAMIPPLWFRVMHPLIDRYKKTTDGVSLE